MMPDVVFKLDRAREFFGAPIILTSGYRSPEYNAEHGGVHNSAHTLGLAADVHAPQDQFMRAKLAWSMALAGFRRLEVCPRHFHVDLDETKPSPACFEGADK